jgi:two-component system KDP operon response regulator KdpE
MTGSEPTARPRVLVIDDDSVTRFVIREALRAEVDILEASDGREGLRAFFSGRPDLVLLDIVMPEMNGREVLSRIRELADTPVIMLTVRDDSSDVVRHLEEGADEYLTKPFRPQELAARVHALLRRAGRPAYEPERRIEAASGQVVIDLHAQRLWVRGEEVSLAPTEFRLLACLAREVGRPVSAARILRDVWGPGYAGELGYVKTYVRRLRQKIEEEPEAPRLVLARRGLGYLLVERLAVVRSASDV